MARRPHVASRARSVSAHPPRSRPLHVATIALAALLAACTTLPGGSPSPTPPAASGGPTASPGALPTATPSATAAPSPSPTPPSPSPTPDGAAWTRVGRAPVPQVDAELTAVGGSAYAMDPAAGFRLRATGDTPVATLVQRLHVEPALAYRVRPAADGRSAILRPVEPLAPGAAYRFTLVDPQGTAVTGWAFQAAGPPRVVGTLPEDQATDVPTDTGIEVTFDQDGVPVKPDDLVVSLLPELSAVAGTVERHGRTATFVPAAALRPGLVYQVAVRAGTGASGASSGLEQAVAFAFRTARESKAGEVRATFDEALSTSLPGERASLAVSAWRMTEDDSEEASAPIAVRVYRFAGEAAALRALVRLEAMPEWAGAESRPLVSTEGLKLAFSGEAAFTRVGWGRRLRLPVATGRGWYLVELRADTRSQAILQVTDVAGMVAAREDRLVAWVNDARTGGPVRGSAVTVVGGPSLGRTDAAGVLLARTPTDVAAASGSVLVRMTASGGRRVVVQLAGRDGFEPKDSWRAETRPDADAWWTAFALDRWLYRPTDTISAWGYLRGRDGRLPTSVLLRLWRDAEGSRVGRPIVEVAARRAATGAFTAVVPLRALPHGGYILQLVADGRLVETTGLAVGEIRKPAYRLTVDVAPRAVTAGTRMTATVTARFFDGTPAAAVPLLAQVDVDDGSLTAAGATGTDGTASLALDAALEGDRQYSCPDVRIRPDGPAEGEITASLGICIFRGVELVDVAAVRGGDSVTLDGAVHRVDLAKAERWLRARETELDARGAAVAGRDVLITISETVHRRVRTSRWYDPIAKRVVERWDLEEVGSRTFTRTVTTRADGTYRLRLPAPAATTTWQVKATIVDANGTELGEQAWVEASTEAGQLPSYWIQVRGEPEVSVGATVTAEVVRSGTRGWEPVPSGTGRFLFTIASPARLDAVAGRAPRVSTRFLATDEPNLQVTAIWFTGRTYVLPGTTGARLRLDDRRLSVSLRADRERYEPGETATLTVRTTDPAGRPVRASVVVRGIDEKLVAMGVAAITDPLELLYARRAVDFAAGPNVSHLASLFEGGGGGSTTGGGDGGRTDFRDALPLQMVTTDASGTARVSVDVPDDITSWRIGAAAFTSNRRAGTGTVLLPVGLPFFVDATVAPEYLVGDLVGIRLRTFGSAVTSDLPVRYTVSSKTLGMAATVVDGRALTEAIVMLPALTPGTHELTMDASSAAGRDRLVRTFTVVESRLAASRRETLAITGPVTPPGGAGVTRLVVVDAGRADHLERLLALAAAEGQRADERLAGTIARELLVGTLGLPADQVPAAPDFDRAVYQSAEGGLALLPYASADLELTARALVARPDALLADGARAWLRGIADGREQTVERRAVALAGLAALGDPVLDELGAVLAEPDAAGRVRLWAAVGLALLGDRARAAAEERDLLERWGERRGSLLRLRVAGDAEDVTEATELLALLAALVDDPQARDALAYVQAVPLRENLASLVEVTVIGRLAARLPAEPAAVAVVQDGERSRLDIPPGSAVALEVVADQLAGLRLEPLAGDAVLVAAWEEPVDGAADLGSTDVDLTLARTFTPVSPVPGNALVTVRLTLEVRGPGRDGEVEVVDLAPSGLVPLATDRGGDEACGPYGVSPTQIDGQRVVFVASFTSDETAEEEGRPTVPGTFCLAYEARVVTAGTYAWEPAVARQTISPALVAVTAAGRVELR